MKRLRICLFVVAAAAGAEIVIVGVSQLFRFPPPPTSSPADHITAAESQQHIDEYLSGRARDSRPELKAPAARTTESHVPVAAPLEHREKVFVDETGDVMTESEMNKAFSAIRSRIESETDPYAKAYLEGLEKALLEQRSRLREVGSP